MHRAQSTEVISCQVPAKFNASPKFTCESCFLLPSASSHTPVTVASSISIHTRHSQSCCGTCHTENSIGVGEARHCHSLPQFPQNTEPVKCPQAPLNEADPLLVLPSGKAVSHVLGIIFCHCYGNPQIPCLVHIWSRLALHC